MLPARDDDDDDQDYPTFQISICFILALGFGK